MAAVDPPESHEPPQTQQSVDESGDNETTSANTRHPYTNDIIAGLMVLMMIGITAAYVYRGAEIPLWLATVDGAAIVTAVMWAFGEGKFNAALDAIKN